MPPAGVAVVGAGVAGTMLALRLAESGTPVDLFTGTRPHDADATGASGGLVRGYEPDPEAAALAAASVAELRSDPRMRDWTGYQEIGSAYVTTAAEPPSQAALDAVHERLPGSLRVAPAADLPLRGMPEDAMAVLERHAGFVSPARLRARVIAELPGAGVRIHRRHVTAVTGGAIRTGTEGWDGYHAVVVAAGAWSRLLVGGRFTTRQIQYGLYPVRVAGLPSFVDETSGLYGRPYEGGRTLLGISSDRWGLRPDEISPDERLAARVTACAADRLGLRAQPQRVVASFDCYCEPSGLMLRRAGDVLTFTGGSDVGPHRHVDLDARGDHRRPDRVRLPGHSRAEPSQESLHRRVPVHASSVSPRSPGRRPRRLRSRPPPQRRRRTRAEIIQVGDVGSVVGTAAPPR